jgi:hypothetical protein
MISGKMKSDRKYRDTVKEPQDGQLALSSLDRYARLFYR